MARNGVNEDLFVKPNNKLEAFLKRHLDEDTFERIRAHEACVVCSKKEDKKFKFLVLTDDWLYLTENPPKRVAEEVHLGNIVSIKLVNDFPEFLSGAERKNTQHILIKYMSRTPPKGKPKRHATKYNGAPNSPGGSLTYRGSLTVRSGTHSAWDRKTQSLKGTRTAHVDLPARSCSMDANMLREVLESERGGGSIGSKKKRPRKVGGGGGARRDSVDSRDEEDGDSVGSAQSRDDLRGGARPPRCPQPRPLPGARDPALKLHVTHTGELRLALEKLAEERDEDDGGDGGRLVTTRTINDTRLSKSHSRLSFFRKTVASGHGEEAVEDAWFPEDLHIYILNLDSPILVLTRAAWNNYLIRETLEQDPEYLERTMGTLDKSPVSEKFSLLFAQLKQELMQQGNTMEDIFSLLNELKVAAERNFTLKKLFWRTPELFVFFVKQLKTYLPNSPAKMYSENEEDKSQRADELEFAILLLETLALMFRETEVLPYRLSSLRHRHGEVVLDLINLVMAQPQLLDLEPRKPARPSLISTPTDDWTPEADIELYTLAEELNVVATTVLSELILIAREANWGDTDGNFLNLCWLSRVLDEATSTEAFVEQVVSSALCLIAPGRVVEALDPVEAVRVFHQFSVLHTIIEYSPTTAAFITDNFYEEFKYFVQGPVILKKLPTHYPIADTTIKYIEQVMSCILGKAVSLALNNALT